MYRVTFDSCYLHSVKVIKEFSQLFRMNKNINIYFSDGMDEYFLYCNAIISFFFTFY